MVQYFHCGGGFKTELGDKIVLNSISCDIEKNPSKIGKILIKSVDCTSVSIWV